jgi:GT2 family glycosyltransferase
MERMVAVDLDEQFYLAWDNVDWCVRVRALAGSALVVPGARVFYKGTGSIRGEITPIVITG